MYQYWFIPCKKCNVTMWDVNNGENWVWKHPAHIYNVILLSHKKKQN